MLYWEDSVMKPFVSVDDDMKECKVGGIHSTRRGNAHKILFWKPEMKITVDLAVEYSVK